MAKNGKEQYIKTSKILGLIAERNITQEKLAEVIGVTRASLSRKINGKNQFKDVEISRIARYFGKDVGYFFTD